MKKKLAGTGLAIGLVAGAGAGYILEMSGTAGASSGISALAAVDDSNATTDTTDATTDTTEATSDTTDATEPPRPDPSARLQEVLQPLVDDGTITQDQADKIIAALAAARPEVGPGGRGGHRGPGGIGDRGGLAIGLDVVATTLGITADDVRTAIEGGQTIAELAVANGKTAQDVIDAIVTESTTRINAAVTDGKLTQAEADERLSDLTARVTEFVNNAAPIGGRGFGGPGHHGDRPAGVPVPAIDDTPVDTTDTTDTTGS